MSRSSEYEVEVTGTPEQVWQAIASGPGISAWFVPTAVEEREGGEVAMDHGGGLEAMGKVTAYDAPRRFAFVEEWQPSPKVEAARVATELLVEARSGGTCVVRLVTSGFGSGAEWDDAVESMNEGWPLVLRHLQIYLEDFAGQEPASIVLGGATPGPLARAWATFTGELGLPAAMSVGDRVRATAGDAPPLAGVVEVADAGNTMLRLSEPAPGVAILGCYAVNDPAVVMLRVFHYGDDAARVATDEPAWRAWMQQRFPQPAAATVEQAQGGGAASTR